MPRILPALKEFIHCSDRPRIESTQYTSHDGKLIITDYSDAEKREHHRDKRRRKDQSAPPQQMAQKEETFDRPLIKDHDAKEDACEYAADLQDRCGTNIYQTKVHRKIPSVGAFMENLEHITEDVRVKPTYSDCWLVGKRSDLETMAEYDTSNGKVLIGIASDGEIEYNLIPNEYGYPDSLNAIISEAIDSIKEWFRKGQGRMDKIAVMTMARSTLIDNSGTIEAIYGNDPYDIETVIKEMSDVIYRYTIGLGIFEVLISDNRLEDIYIDAPCDANRIHVTMNGIEGLNSHMRCRTNLIVDRKEVMNLINVLKRESGLPFCESNPILETDMRNYDARATVIGYPMSPNGDAVAIRKRSTRPWTLTRLIANGTLDPKIAGLLSFLVDNRATFLICGPRGSGKSSMLAALMFEFPMSQRILTIEDTMELPSDMMRRMGYKIQSLLIDGRMEGDELSKADEALRVSLRMGESAIILGEVRGEEAKTLYQSMRTGRAGSSIMGTIHGDSARTVYERVVHDMNISPEAFMSTEVLVTLGTIRERRTGNQIRRLREVVATGSDPGDFLDITGNDMLFESPVMRRALSTSQLSRSEAMKEIRARGMIRAFLAEMGNQNGDRFFGPEWISMSNEHILKNRGGTAEEMLRSFKVKFNSISGVGE